MAPLILVLEFGRAERTQDPFGFSFVPQDYLLRTQGGGFNRANFVWDQDLLQDLDAMRQPGCDPVVPARLGERLRHFVTPLGWPELAAQARAASEQGRRILLTIRSAAAELYALPWELLTLKASGQHISELAGLLLRYEWPETTTTPGLPRLRSGSERILVAWSAAGGPVPAAEHVRAVAKACEAGAHPFDPVRDVLDNVSLGRLSDTLSAAKREGRPVAVLHLLCHGGRVESTFGLVLDGEPDQPALSVADAGRLRQVIGSHADMVRLVVLCACDSANTGRIGNALGSIAQTLHRAGIAAVVASRYPLSVAGSVRLTQSLHSALFAELTSLESALLGTRCELAKDGTNFDWASLQLYARAADGEDSRPIVFRPYRGLSVFHREHHRFFFGREALTEKLWSRIQELVATSGAIRLFTVHGPSGSGKSSVVHAGLIVELERRPLSFADWSAGVPMQVVILKPGEHPQRALTAALPADRASAPLLLVVDQFEEIYTQCTDAAERTGFVERLLAEAAAPGHPTLIVLTLRSDFIGETQRHHPALNRLFDKQAQLVTALSPEELRRVIAEPAALLGRPMDDATIDLLLNEAQGSEGALPLLEFALSQIWEGMLVGKPPAETLHQIGGVGGALARTAQDTFGLLSPAEQAVARRALVRLVRLGDGVQYTRRRMPIGELCGRGGSEAQVLAILRKFATEQARLLTLSVDGSATIAEVTHEALFEHWAELRAWLKESRKERELHDRALEAAKLWDQDGRPAGRLWRPPDLDLLRAYQQRMPDEILPLQEGFLAAGVYLQRQEKLLRIGAVTLILGALFIAAIIYVGAQRQRAQEAKTREEAANREAERARQQLWDTYVERGQKLLFESRNSNEAILWLHRAYAAGSKNDILPDLLKSAMQSIDATTAVFVSKVSRFRSAEFALGDRRILLVDDDTAQVWDADGPRLLANVQLLADAGGASGVVFSPDGRRILTPGKGNTAQLWDGNDGHLLAVLKDLDAPINIEMISPDGRRILIVGDNNTACVWDAESARLLAKITVPGDADPAFHTTISSDGQRVLAPGKGQTAELFDASDGHLLATLKGHKGPARTAVFSANGRRILVAGRNDVARVWEADGHRLVATIKLHPPEDTEQEAMLSPDGRLLAISLNQGGATQIWDVDQGSLQAELKSRDPLTTVAFSPDGDQVLTEGMDRIPRVWDAMNGSLAHELVTNGSEARHLPAAKFDQHYAEASFSPDGNRIITTGMDDTVRVWNATSGDLLVELRGHGGAVVLAAFSHDGNQVLTVSEDKTARVWNLADRRLMWTTHAVSGSFSPDSRRIVATLPQESVRILDTDHGRAQLELKGSSLMGIRRARFSPDGRQILTAGTDKAARVWDAESGAPVLALTDHESGVASAEFSPDGRRIVTVSDSSRARVWDASSGRLLRQIDKEADVKHATFGPDSRHLLATGRPAESAGPVQKAWLWDVDTGRLVTELSAVGNNAAYGATLSPDGHRIVTAGPVYTASLWDAGSGSLLHVLKGHASYVSSAEFSRDGQRILTASADRTAWVWNTSDGSLLAKLKGHTAGVSSATFSVDGRRIATGSLDHTAAVWDASSDRLLAVLKGHYETVVSATFSPDGHRLLTTSTDGTMRLWDVGPETRTPDQIARLIGCYVPARFEREGSSVILSSMPSPAACQTQPRP